MSNDEAINHPAHYTKGKIEVSDFIADQKLDFFEGNVIKYVCRWKYKRGVEDLEKARWYLNKLIDLNKEPVISTTQVPQCDVTKIIIEGFK